MVTSFTTKFNTELLFASRFKERVATVVVDSVIDAGAGSFAVDDDYVVDADFFLLYPFFFCCSRCLEVLIFVEVKAIKKM